jgi:hypothetical protein
MTIRFIWPQYEEREMTKKQSPKLTEEQEQARTKRLIAVLMAGIKAKKKDPSIRKEDILAAGRAAYKKDPTKSGH